VLTYVFLISLIVFLFYEALVRIICMSLILIRICFFEIHLASPDPYINFILSLIILVFLLYGIKIYAVETAQKRGALFVQHMTHDLQISYSSVEFIVSHLESLIDPNETKDPKTLLIKKLSKASSFYAYIKRNFLEFSRYEGGSIGVNHIEEIDLATDLEEIVELYKPLAAEKNIQIVLDIDDRLPQLIRSDKIKVTRIVLNLITNAVNHTYSGKTISITVEWENDVWRLMVANEGAEIPPDRLQKIFNIYEFTSAARKKRRLDAAFFYQQTKPVENRRRLGLGLPITKQLVDALGGNISAASKKDHETLFTVAFPIQ
jgi:two-component system sensor histidine kinase/response regulator